MGVLVGGLGEGVFVETGVTGVGVAVGVLARNQGLVNCEFLKKSKSKVPTLSTPDAEGWMPSSSKSLSSHTRPSERGVRPFAQR